MNPKSDAMSKVKELLFGEEVLTIEKKIDQFEKQTKKHQEQQQTKRENAENKLSNRIKELQASLDLNTSKSEEGLAATKLLLTESIKTYNLKLTNDIKELQKEANTQANQLKKDLSLFKETTLETLKRMEQNHSLALSNINKTHVSKDTLSAMLIDMGQKLVSQVEEKGKNNETFN